MAHILVVEDDRSFGENLRIHLTALGHEVALGCDPAIGLRSLLESRPDLILLDLNMPYLDGLELLKAVRGEKATCHIPVVVITGRPDEDSRLQATQLGVTRYLAKPVRLSDLMEAVEHSLGKSKSGKT